MTVVGAWIGQIRRVVYDPRLWLPAPRRIIHSSASIALDPYRLTASDTLYLVGTHSRDAVLFVLPPTSSTSTVRRVLVEVDQSPHPMNIASVRQLLLVFAEDS